MNKKIVFQINMKKESSYQYKSIMLLVRENHCFQLTIKMINKRNKIAIIQDFELQKNSVKSFLRKLGFERDLVINTCLLPMIKWCIEKILFSSEIADTHSCRCFNMEFILRKIIHLHQN